MTQPAFDQARAENSRSRIFSIGFNNSDSFFPLLEKYWDHVFNVYFSIPGLELASGRPFESLQEKFKGRDYLRRLGLASSELGITLDLLFNSSYDLAAPPRKAELMRGILSRILDAGVPLSRITVCDRMAVIHLREDFPGFLEHTGISVENSIADTTRYSSLSDVARDFQIFDRIKLPPDNYRSVPFLKSLLSAYPPALFTLTVNEGCLPNCPFRTIHNFLHINEVKLPQGTYCRYYLNRNGLNPMLYLRRIVPALLDRYLELGFTEYKIANRNLSTEQTEALVRSYIYRDQPEVYDVSRMFTAEFLRRFQDATYSCDFRCAERKCELCKEGFEPVQRAREGGITLCEQPASTR